MNEFHSPITKQLLIGVALTIRLLDGQSQPSNAGQSKIGFVQNAQDVDGAGCSLWLRDDSTNAENRRIFMSDFEGRAAINIGGHDVALTLVTSSKPNGDPRRGAKSSFLYRAGETEVRIKYVVTGLFPPSDESCEVIDYDAVVTVATISGKQSLRAHGICGS